jgi:hypothetical protein
MASLDRKPALRLSILDSGQSLVAADLERPSDRVQASGPRRPVARHAGELGDQEAGGGFTLCHVSSARSPS